MARKNRKNRGTKNSASVQGSGKRDNIPFEDLSFWQRRKYVGEAKELLGELRHLYKRFGAKTDAEKASIKYRILKNIPGFGPGSNPLFSEAVTGEIKDSMDAFVEVRSKKGDLRPLVRKMGDQLEASELKPLRRSKMWGYMSSFIIAASVALFLRAFAFEPFRIPSGSMIPTLQVGDYIYVNKFVYGLRIPFTQHPPRHFVSWSLPERGDIVVFIEPLNNSEDWIKRVVALPGDHVKFDYDHNQLYLKKGGKGEWTPVPRKQLDKPCAYMDKNEKLGEDWHPGKPCELYEEKLGGKTYEVLYDKVRRGAPMGYPTSWVVGSNCVFVMGDNRDNSEDSRFLAKNGSPAPCIPVNNIKGRAEFIWLSRGPDGMRWSRIFSGVH
ncbi:signal peptidase I [Myxococcota bacterium]|nr:signal peptidase I [Myxococcota bacterium]MBU1537404.1 signal peptidase I [Myxococcota bacterium]